MKQLRHVDCSIPYSVCEYVRKHIRIGSITSELTTAQPEGEGKHNRQDGNGEPGGNTNKDVAVVGGRKPNPTRTSLQ